MNDTSPRNPTQGQKGLSAACTHGSAPHIFPGPYWGMVMQLSSQGAKRLFEHPGPFAIAVIKQFRANQGILLAGAVAYYTLLSLVPLLILILLALSHVVDEERLLVTLRASLEFVVPEIGRASCRERV